jgi:hypothetical protein
MGWDRGIFHGSVGGIIGIPWWGIEGACQGAVGIHIRHVSYQMGSQGATKSFVTA